MIAQLYEILLHGRCLDRRGTRESLFVLIAKDKHKIDESSKEPKNALNSLFQGQLTASVRVDSDVGPPLPKGFRPCEQVETNTCIRGSCGVDPLNNIVCMWVSSCYLNFLFNFSCPFGWSGSKCDTPQGQVKLRPDRNTDCLICKSQGSQQL